MYAIRYEYDTKEASFIYTSEGEQNNREGSARERGGHSHGVCGKDILVLGGAEDQHCAPSTGGLFGARGACVVWCVWVCAHRVCERALKPPSSVCAL